MDNQQTYAPQNPEYRAPNERSIVYHSNAMDHSQFMVCRILPQGGEEVIGFIYTEIEGDETLYRATDRKGEQLMPPTTDFNKVDQKYERFASFISMQHKVKDYLNDLSKRNYLPKLNQTNMTTNQKTEKKKFNQLVFVEYEKAKKDGHVITIVDSFRNTIGRIYKNFNEESKKFEFTAFDHEGNLLSKNEKLWIVKNGYVENREQLLENAHQRRIAEKEERAKTEEKAPENTQANVNSKAPQTKAQVASEKSSAREEELEDLRGEQGEDLGDFDMDR